MHDLHCQSLLVIINHPPHPFRHTRAALPRRTPRSSRADGLHSAGQGLEILGERMEFTAPVVLSSLDSEMQLDRPSWTLSAWVELKADNSSSDHSAPARKFSILRRPDANNRKLNCWGWYHPAEFR